MERNKALEFEETEEIQEETLKTTVPTTNDSEHHTSTTIRTT
jgi:hypothetical protein